MAISISIFGDSLSTYQNYNPPGYAVFYDYEMQTKTGVYSVYDTWWAKVLRSLGAVLCVNNSYSGSRVSGRGFPSAVCRERLENLKNESIVPDYIFVYLGFNDFGNGIPLDGNSTDAFFFAYKWMIEQLKSLYSTTNIFCATLMRTYMRDNPSWVFPEQFAGKAFGDYNAAIRETCKQQDVMLVDLEKTGLKYETLDGSHPTAKGHETVAEAWLTCLEHTCLINNRLMNIKLDKDTK